MSLVLCVGGFVVLSYNVDRRMLSGLLFTVVVSVMVVVALMVPI